MARVKSEYEVESLFIDKLQEMNYEYVNLRNYTDVVDNFRMQVCRLNASALIEKKGEALLSDNEFHRVMLRVENHTVYESAKILRENWVLELDNGESVYLKFLTDDISKNIYQVTHQVTMDKTHIDSVLNKNRYDVTILINGLPLVQVELKRPGIEINEAINQINRYRNDSFKGLFRYIQIFVVSNSTQTKYFANANERDIKGERIDILKSAVFYWTDKENKRINKLFDFTDSFLDKFALTEILNKFYVIKQSEPVLLVMRPYQIYAVKMAYDRVKGSHLSGFVHHTTGSGKTLTSFKLATLLRDDSQIEKVFFLIDRKDLDDQTVDEYNSFELGCVDNTPSTKRLVEDIEDSTKTMIITTIQKMATALHKEKYAKVMNKLKDSRCVFIIDECHRSNFGKMHGDIERHFKNADFIGFTGTPIYKENIGAAKKTTADVFKAGILDSCIHKYMIKEAIADGNVLSFSVEYLRAKEIGGQYKSEVDYCKQNSIDISSYYHESKRMEGIAKDIINNLERHVHPEGKDIYTAIFAVDRVDTLLKYYDLLKKHNTKGYKIAAICHCQDNEEKEEGTDKTSLEKFKVCIKEYNDTFNTRYEIDTFDAYRRDIMKRMKQKELPQIDLLMVVDMMLTGFDSKPTNLLILDKNLEFHKLLQAYSRTNRVDKVTKKFGQIVTYRDIKEAQDVALRLFSGDGNPNGFLLAPYETYVENYRKEAEELRAIAATPDDAGYLVSEYEKAAYIKAYRKLANTYGTLKTFSKFNQEDIDPYLDEAEYYDYKSWYLAFYDEMDRKRKRGEDSSLIDIDFSIELIRTDRINVVYILNLLKDINRNNKDEMDKSVDLILREIERSDNEKLRYKKDIMKAFIKEKFFDLDPKEDIVKAYTEYEKERLDNDVEEFSVQKNIDKQIIDEILSQYFCNEKSITEEDVRQKISGLGLGLIRTTELIDDIFAFIQEMYNKFTTEGE